MIQRPLLTAAACAAAIALSTACSTAPQRSDPYSNPPSTVYSSPSNAYAQYGQVQRISVVPVAARNSGAGAILGAVIGAVVGNQVGSGQGRAAATVVGAVGGAVAGNEIQKRNRRDDEVFRVNVRMDDGSYRDFDVQRIDDLREGDRVKFEGGQLHRY